MSKDRKKPPVRSFGPELMAALIRGATTGFTLKMPYNKAVRFRSRIYLLRSAMRAEDHSQYDLVARVKITITWPAGTKIVSDRGGDRPAFGHSEVAVNVAPHDSEFADVLRDAGIDPDMAPAATSAGAQDFSSIDDLLDSIKGDIK